jgi:hypothetical protein
MYCTNCGKELCNEAVICTGCGVSIKPVEQSDKNEKAGFWLCLLGFLFPIAGLILYLVLKDSSPRKAKSIGIAALIGVVLEVVFSILCFAVYIFAIGSAIFETSSYYI